MQGVFELFDKDCTGVVDWSTFTKLVLSLIPDRVLRADAVQFIAAQAEDPSCSIDYREFCISGKVRPSVLPYVAMCYPCVCLSPVVVAAGRW